MNPPIQYIPNFLPDADKAFKALREELAWVQRDQTPRMEYYCNDFPEPYVYGSGRGVRLYEPQPYHPVIREIRSRVEEKVKAALEVSFLNFYKDQKGQLGDHSDNSPTMDDARPIGIVSLGVEREIWFRRITTLKGDDRPPYTKLKLGHGSLCIMLPGMQDDWTHRIPRASFECGERISDTLRGYVPTA